MSGERIAKYIASCGIASRRKSEAFVSEGRVKVNGETVTDLGRKVEPEDVLELDSNRISPSKEHVYIMLNKPKGYLTSVSDDRGRPTVISLIDAGGHRVYPVGRLDMDSEGLMLITDDGSLASKLMHPSKNVDKKYVVSLSRPIKEEYLKQLRIGIMLEEELTAPAEVRILHPSGLILEVTIHEGRKRQVRRMIEAVGSRVLSLKRISLGPLSLGELKPGQSRHLNSEEIEGLKRTVE